MTKYRVWYEPYGLIGESDFMDVEAVNETEARRFVSSFGWIESVEKMGGLSK